MDNIKAVLIFLVVLGHFLEQISGEHILFILKMIYVFHMPAFLFISGYFAKYSVKKTLYRLIFPYIFFQSMYIMFDNCVIHEFNWGAIQFTIPYIVMWYLLSDAVYHMLIPAIKTDNEKRAYKILAISIFISLWVGYEYTIGEYLSLSRTAVFSPFFIGGYYTANVFDKKARYLMIRYKCILMLFCIVCIFLSGYWILKNDISMNNFYCMYSYYVDGCNITNRFIMLVTAFAWLLLLFRIIPDKNLSFITAIGQRTMPIYLLHILFQRISTKYGVFHYSEITNFCLAFIMTVILVVILSCASVHR